MANLTWKDAIIKVLKDEKKALHYTEIAELIAERGYRTSFGVTPQDTVSANITSDIKNKKENSIFVRVNPGIYTLKELLDKSSELEVEDVDSEVVLGYRHEKENKIVNRVINAFGIYWNRNLVHWKSHPDLYGVQQIGANRVNFNNQIGVYLLHDSRETIYVGQAIDQPLGKRLRMHTIDRMSGRWDRFSWFGFYPISEKGKLITDIELEEMSFKNIGDMLEAILIESIEPRQNRKQGNHFTGLEFLQLLDPELERLRKQQIIRDLSDKI